MNGQGGKTVTILHTNDFHGRYRAVELSRGSATAQTGDPGRSWYEFERAGRAGGFPALATAVKRIREERGADNVILVDGGDTFSDDLLGNLTRGETVIRLMNTLGYQLMALGNHDFDYGSERTKELQEMASFPMRAANVVERETGQPFLGDPTLVVKAGGVRAGFLTLGYHNTDKTGNRDNNASLAFHNGVETARQYLPASREQADIVVVLSHQGTAMDRVLAQEVEGIDLIIGAHSHDALSLEWVGQTPLVQAVSDGTMLGEAIFTVEHGRVVGLEHRLHTLWTEQFPDDEQVAQQVQALREPHQGQLEEVIATAVEPIGRNYRSESPFDKLVGEIMMEKSGAQIAFMPGVGYGVTLQPGPVTREALYVLIPHPAKLVTMELSGAQVLDILEQSATNQKPGKPEQIAGGLVQTAGISWTVDFSRPVGERVSGVRVAGEPIAAASAYLIATNAGMSRGLHNYRAFTEGRNVQVHDIQVNELVERAFSERENVHPPQQGDIILKGA